MARVCGSRRNFVEFLGVNLEWRIPTSASSAADASFFEFFSHARGSRKGWSVPSIFSFPQNAPTIFFNLSYVPLFCQQQIQSLDSSLAFWSSLFEFFLNNVALKIFFHPTFVQKSIKIKIKYCLLHSIILPKFFITYI